MFYEVLDMDNKNYKVLILAIGCNYIHVTRFVTNLKRTNPDAELVLFTGLKKEELDPELFDSLSEIIYRKKSDSKGRLGSIKNIWALINQFRWLSKNRRFDIVNIHFPILLYAPIMPFIKRMAKSVVASPWGSDILRVNGWRFKMLCKMVLNKCDYITIRKNSNIGEKISSVLNKPKEFFVPLMWGSESIDYICDKSESVSTDDAKKMLGISNSYVITCGYNAFPSQRHENIIDAIADEKKNLPSDLLLLFPVTYGFDDRSDYIRGLKEKCQHLGLSALFFESFMPMSELYIVRMATDMFVHIQPTDSQSSSIQEYVLCNKKIVHGSWISYPNLEKYPPLFYFPVDDLKDLGSVIVKTYQSEPIVYSQGLIEEIKSHGWREKMKLWDDFFIQIGK